MILIVMGLGNMKTNECQTSILVRIFYECDFIELNCVSILQRYSTKIEFVISNLLH